MSLAPHAVALPCGQRRLGGRFIVRDSDGRLTARDAAMVGEWLALKERPPLHCIRDHPSHGKFSLSGGLFGGTPSVVNSLFGGDGGFAKAMAGYREEYLQVRAAFHKAGARL